MDELVEINVLALEKALQLYCSESCKQENTDSRATSVASCVKAIRGAVLRLKSEVATAKAGKRGGADKVVGKAVQARGSSAALVRRPSNSTSVDNTATGATDKTAPQAPQLSVSHVAHVDYLNRITSHLKENSPARPSTPLVLLDSHQQRQLSLQDNLHYVNSLFKIAKNEISAKSNMVGQGGSLLGGDVDADSIEEKGNDSPPTNPPPLRPGGPEDDTIPEYDGAAAAADQCSESSSTRSFSPELFSATSGQPIFSATGEPLEDFWIQGGTSLTALSHLGQEDEEPAALKSSFGATYSLSSFVQKARQPQDLSSCYDELADAFEMPP